MDDNFKALNLDDKLISKNSLLSQPSDTTTGYKFDTNYQRGAISKNKIKNFSFSQGEGGTIILGGTNNGNGLLRVNDSSGGTVATLDNNGLTVTNGSITIINSSGSTILDSIGLSSLANFINGANAGTSILSTNSTTPADIPDTSLSFALSRSGNVLIGYSAKITAAGTSSGTIFGGELTPRVDDILLTSYPVARSEFSLALSGTAAIATFITSQTVGATKLLSLTAGTHTVKLKAASATDTAITSFVDVNIFYVILGS